MPQTFARYMLITFTLLALIGQSVMANGSAMAMIAMDMQMMTKNMPSDDMSHSSHSHHLTATQSASHTDKGVMNHANCCNDDMLPGAKQPCCDGATSCVHDCGHCMTISMTGPLFSPHLWPSVNNADTAMATPLPHFHSIDLPSALKPPIA